MKTKKKTIYVRLVSSRGSDHSTILVLEQGQKDVDAAEEWAKTITNGSAIESYTVTYKTVKLLTRTEWLKRWDKHCKQAKRIKDQRQFLTAQSTHYNHVCSQKKLKPS